MGGPLPARPRARGRCIAGRVSSHRHMRSCRLSPFTKSSSSPSHADRLMTTTIASPITALEQAAARASTFDDRLSGACHLTNDASDALIADRLEQSRTRLGPNPELFARRLAWDSWGAAEQRTLLGDVEYADGAPTPTWVT